MATFEETLQRLDGYPEGTAADWIARYEPLTEQILRHREVEAPLVSVVLVAWNAAAFLESCLVHLRDQVGVAGEVEVVLVDNGGNEALRPRLAELVDVEVRMRGNAHLCRARNLGVAVAQGALVNFVDDDGLVERDYTRNALRYFEDPDVLAIRGRIVAKHHPYFTTLATHYSRGPRPVDDCLVTEGSSFVRRDAYVEVGGFAEDMSGHEGIDLTHRLLSRYPNGRVMYVPDVVMRHDYIDTWSKFIRKNWRYAGVNDRTQSRDEDLAGFMDAYFQRRFQGASLSLKERVAREGLKAIRTTLRIGAAATAKVSR